MPHALGRGSPEYPKQVSLSQTLERAGDVITTRRETFSCVSVVAVRHYPTDAGGPATPVPRAPPDSAVVLALPLVAPASRPTAGFGAQHHIALRLASAWISACAQLCSAQRQARGDASRYNRESAGEDSG